MKRLLAVVATSVVLLFSSVPAQATNHWPVLWTYGTVFVRLSNNTSWTTNQIASVQTAVNEWNNARNAGDPVLSFAATPLSSWGGCGNTNADVVVEKVGSGYLGGPLARTDVCNGSPLTDVHLLFETRTNSYFGPDNPEPSGDIGERGVLTHEFGHVEGFDLHWNSDHPEYCDQSHSASRWRTMCSSFWEDSTGQDDNNNSITLHADDISSFNNAYT